MWKSRNLIWPGVGSADETFAVKCPSVSSLNKLKRSKLGVHCYLACCEAEIFTTAVSPKLFKAGLGLARNHRYEEFSLSSDRAGILASW